MIWDEREVVKKDKLSIKVNITELDVFKKVINILKGILEDERIPDDVKAEVRKEIEEAIGDNDNE